MLIDESRCHAGESWFEPIELLVYQMHANDVDRDAQVQRRGAFDNTYMPESARRSRAVRGRCIGGHDSCRRACCVGEIGARPSVLRPESRFGDTPPLLEIAYDAFGPRRMMWVA